MKAYSLDLRQRIVRTAGRGMSRAQIATTFAVSLSTVQRLLARKRRNAEDTLTAQTPPGRRRTISSDQHATLWAQLEANRDATREVHTQLWNATQATSVSEWTVGRAIRRLGWTRKKRRWEPPSGTSRPELPTAFR